MYPAECLGLCLGRSFVLSCMLTWWAPRGGQLALCQVDSCISQTFDPGCCGQKVGKWAGGQKVGSAVACSRTWVCVIIPLLYLGAVCLEPLAAFPVHLFSHLQDRGANRTYLLMMLAVPALPPGKMWGPQVTQALWTLEHVPL